MVKRKNPIPPRLRSLASTSNDVNNVKESTQLNSSSPSEEETARGTIPSSTQEDANAKTVLSANIPKKRKLRSVVWEHFSKLPNKDGEDKYAQCNYCGAKYLADSDKHGTKNLRRHMDICKKMPRKKGPMDNYKLSYDGDNAYSEMLIHKFDQNDIRDALVEWIVCDELPFRTVTSESFKKFCKKMEPKFQVPSRTTVARLLSKLYCSEMEKLKSALKGKIGRVSLTIDTWTSIDNKSYMCVTAHFIDKSWVLHKRIISFKMLENHSGENIGKQLENISKEWGIEKIMCITVDNASVNQVAVEWMKKYENNNLFGGEYIHVRCFAHILNILVKYGLKKCHQSIERIRAAVKYVKSSPKRQLKFEECAKAVDIHCTQGLSLDVPTRWNSTYTMLQSAEKYERVFDRMSDEDVGFRQACLNVSGCPKFDDWENGRKLIPFLKSFYDATTLVSGSNYVTINQYFSQFCQIRTLLMEVLMKSENIVFDVALDMKEKYDAYFGNQFRVNMLVYVALILDPRSKLEVVKRGLHRVFATDGYFNELYEDTQLLLRELYEDYRFASGVPNVSNSNENLSFAQARSASADNDPSLAGLWDVVCDRTEYLTINSRSELDLYLNEPRETPRTCFDLLGWWKLHEARFPILSSMARDIFAIPASTVSSESAFSTSGRVITNRRCSLLPQTVESLICTQSWLKNVILIDAEDIEIDDETAEMVESAVIEEIDGPPSPLTQSSVGTSTPQSNK